MKHLFVLAELLNEFLNPVFVEESFLFRRITTLIGEVDLEAGIQKCQLAQTRRQPFKFKFGRDREDRRIGQKRDERAGGLFVFDLADDGELVGRFTLGEGHVIDLAVARDFHLEPFGKRIRAFRAHTMQTAGIFVSALTEFSARVQVREHQLDCWHLPFRMNIDRNTAAIVAHRNAAFDMHCNLDLVAKSGEMFVDRIVEHLENHVVQTALVRVANVHPRPFSDRFQTFEFVNLRGVVLLQFVDDRKLALTSFGVGIFVVRIGENRGSRWHRKNVAKSAEKTTNNLVVPSELFALYLEGEAASRPTILWSASTSPRACFLPA